MTYTLQTKALSKRFGRHMAVNQLNLQVPKGSVYGLLGPNGAGKSTMLKLVTGLARPTSGEIHLFGQPWRREHLSRMGALIEAPALYGNLTARENLEEVHRLLLDVPAGRIDEVLSMVDLTETGRKPARQFSLGMKQRLAIASALLSQPELLILDEPTNGLDPIGIQEMRRLIRSFQESGITVIISSHLLQEVAHVVTHAGIIYQGRLLFQGAVDPGDDLEQLFMKTIAQGGK